MLFLLLGACLLGRWSDDDTGQPGLDDTGCQVKWCPDADDDGFGDGSQDGLRCSWSCEQVLDFIQDDRDCDDLDGTINPDGAEVCDGADNDCDGLTDDDDDSISGQSLWYVDSDGDGWGGESLGLACDPPADSSTKGGDCDDSEVLAAPDLDEVCGDGIDNDCDGSGEECRFDGNISVGTAALTLASEQTASEFGDTVELCQDLTGDGVPDMLIGARADTEYAVDPAAWIIPGGLTGSHTAADVGIRLGSADPDSELANSLTCADIDGDGNTDVMLGAPAHVDDSGQRLGMAGIIFGPISSNLSATAADIVIWGEVPDARLGEAVHLGDLDGDGADEAVVTTWNEPIDTEDDLGGIYVFRHEQLARGRELTPSQAVLTVLGSRPESELGFRRTVTSADFDGDGIGALAFSDHGWPYNSSNPRAGRVWVLQDPLAKGSDPIDLVADMGIQVSASLAHSATGSELAVGDVDEDGLDELIVVGHLSELNTVMVFSLDGVEDGAELTPDDADIRIGREDEDGCGGGLDVRGDLDGDGLPDLAVNNFCSSYRAETSGVVHVFFGPLEPGSWTMEEAPATFETTEAGAQLGRGLSTAADIDNDGLDEILIGAPRGRSEGAAYLFYGKGL